MKKKKQTTDPALDVNSDIQPQEEWEKAKSTANSEPGTKPDEKEKPEEAWTGEKETKKLDK